MTRRGTVQPVKVAEVLPDPETHESGIHVEPNYKAMLYQVGQARSWRRACRQMLSPLSVG